MYIDVIDKVWKGDAKTTVEWMLNFPLDFLKGKNVVEIGCGTGRFTREYANHVVALDLSNAIFANLAPPSSNLTLIKGNMNVMHEYLNDFDVVICYGVIQHTEDPRKSVSDLFKYANNNGLIVFNVYMGDKKAFKTHAKYVLRNYMKIETDIFIKLMDMYTDELYNFVNKYNTVVKKKYRKCEEFGILIENAVNKFNEHIKTNSISNTINIMQDDIKNITEFMFNNTPVTAYANERNINPFVDESDLKELLKCDLVDGLLAYYDNPLSYKDVDLVINEMNSKNKTDITLINYNDNKNTYLYSVKNIISFHGIPSYNLKTLEILDNSNIPNISTYDIVYFKYLFGPNDLNNMNNMKKDSIIIFTSKDIKKITEKFISIGIYPFYYNLNKKNKIYTFKCKINKNTLFSNIMFTKQGPKLKRIQ